MSNVFPREGLEAAKKLAMGAKIRIPCPGHCGTDKSCIVSHEPKCYRIYCFRGCFNTSRSKGYQSLYELQRIKEFNEKAKQQAKELVLPSDITYNTEEWSPHARFWLWNASIYGGLLRKYKIGFSPGSGRVVLPVYQEDDLVYFQLRNVIPFSTAAKYVNPSIDRSRVLYWVIPDDYTMDKVVIVEDILSAIRVGQFIPAVSLMGTKMSVEQALAISEFDTAVTWLDPDPAGTRGAFKTRKALSLTMNTENITSEVDPKRLSNRNIKRILTEASCLNKNFPGNA